MEQQEYVSPSVELEPEDPKTPFERFGEVFTAPAESFSGLGAARKGPIILWGLVITVIVSMFSAVLFSTNDGIREKAKQEQLEKLEKMRDDGQLSDQQYEQQAEVMETMMSGTAFLIFGVVGSAFVAVLFAVITGLAVLVIIRVLQRDSDPTLGYSAALSATLIAFMIMNLETIITAVGMMFTGNIDFRISPVLFGAPENVYLKFFLNLINPFTIWMWFALGTGIALLAKADRMKAIGILAGVWVVVGLIITAIGSLFT